MIVPFECLFTLVNVCEMVKTITITPVNSQQDSVEISDEDTERLYERASHWWLEEFAPIRQDVEEHKDEITDIVIKSDDAVNKLLIALKFIAEVAMDRAGFQILLNDGDKAQKLSKSVMYIHMAHRLFQDYSVGIENDDLQEVFMLR